MVDEVRVERLLRSLSDDVAYLREESGAGEDRRADPAWLRAVKYTFVTAIEADLAGGLAVAVGFHNVLVHEYVTVDDEIVMARLGDLSELEAFMAAVAA